MGVFTDFLQAADTVSPTAGGIDGSIRHQIESVRDLLDNPAIQPQLAGTDEVQSLAVYQGTVSGGTFTLGFTLSDGTNFTTAAIAFDADAATIESAIDTAANGTVAGWTNGDIAVAGGPLTTTAVTFTFGGESVDQANHSLIVVDGSLLTGGGSAGAVMQTMPGQSGRTAWSVLQYCGIIGGTIPEQGANPDNIVDAGGFVGNPYRLSVPAIKVLALSAARQDGNDAVYGQILSTLGIEP